MDFQIDTKLINDCLTKYSEDVIQTLESLSVNNVPISELTEAELATINSALIHAASNNMNDALLKVKTSTVEEKFGTYIKTLPLITHIKYFEMKLDELSKDKLNLFRR